MSELKEEEYFGYSVDTGVGCFMDTEVEEMMLDSEWQAQTDDTVSATKLEKILDQNSNNSWTWANLIVNETNQGNVIAFSSGWGDGQYPTYFGYDEQERLTNVVTDFLLF